MWLGDEITMPHRLILRCTVETKPSAANRCATALRQIAATLAGGGITAEEFQRALRPLQREAEIDMRTNTWWLDRLAEAQSKHAEFAAQVGLASAYARVTREDVEALAKTLLRKENTAELIATPK
jgi:predicted Zn-dependent peptidase